MATLTAKLRESLAEADLDRGVINDVPLSRAHALTSRGLIEDTWRRGHKAKSEAGTFPHFRGVKLTAEGMRIARRVKGLLPD